MNEFWNLYRIWRFLRRLPFVRHDVRVLTMATPLKDVEINIDFQNLFVTRFSIFLPYSAAT